MGIVQFKIIRKPVDEQKGPNVSNQIKQVEVSNTNNSFLPYLLEYIDNDEVSKKFFIEVSDYIKSIDNNSRLNLCNEIQRFCEEFNKLIIQTKNERENLRKILRVSDEESISLKAAPRYNDREGMGIGGIGHYGFTNSERFGITFNGIKITKKMLENGENPYQVEYNNKKKEIENSQDEIINIKKAIEYLKSQKSFFKRKERAKKIELLELRLNEINAKNNDDLKIKESIEAYNRFTLEEKTAIKNYLDLVDKCEQCSIMLQEKIDLLANFGYSLQINNEEIMKSVIEKMIQSGLITEIQVSDIISKLSSKNIKGLNRISSDPYKYSKVVSSFFDTFVGSFEEKEENSENE